MVGPTITISSDSEEDVADEDVDGQDVDGEDVADKDYWAHVAEQSTDEDSDDRDDGLNFHRITKSGQQALLAANGSNQCYAIVTIAMLLSNPHIHQLFRSMLHSGGSRMETFLHGLCHRPHHTIVPDINRLRQLVVEEHKRQGLRCEDFTLSQQQDAEEFMHALMQTMCIEGTLSKTNRQNFLDIMGFTSRSRTTCTVAECKKNSYSKVEHSFVVQLGINADSVDGCIKEEIGKTVPVPVNECDICHTQEVTWQVTLTDVLPKKCVAIQLKRFNANNQKIINAVTVNIHLTEAPFSGYRLTGAILHHKGSTQRGHYTHMLRDVENGTWVSTDDRKRSFLSEDEALNNLKTTGYVLLYSSPDPFPPALKAIKDAGRDSEEQEGKGAEENGHDAGEGDGSNQQDISQQMHDENEPAVSPDLSADSPAGPSARDETTAIPESPAGPSAGDETTVIPESQIDNDLPDLTCPTQGSLDRLLRSKKVFSSYVFDN